MQTHAKLAGVFGLTVLLAACGAPTGAPAATSSNAGAQPAAPTTAPATLAPTIVATATTESMNMGNTGGATEAAPFDAQFIDSMVIHHQGAIDMAMQAKAEAERPELKALADEIIKAQQAEIDQMTAWRKAWYPELPDTGGMGMGMGMMEVATGDAPYDLRFIDAMIPHHEGAVAMAEEVKLKSQRPELLALADSIIAAQQAEIAQMREWRAAWAPTEPLAADISAAIVVQPQMVMGNIVTIEMVRSPEDGWLVIHADDAGQPGEVLGSAPVKAGETAALEVKLNKAVSPMIAMLHTDQGEVGKLELDGADVSFMLDGKPVMATIDAMIH